MERFLGQFNILVVIDIFKFSGSPLAFNLEFVFIQVIVSLCWRDELALVAVQLELGLILELSPLLLYAFAHDVPAPPASGLAVAGDVLLDSNALQLVVEEVHFTYFYEF